MSGIKKKPAKPKKTVSFSDLPTLGKEQEKLKQAASQQNVQFSSGLPLIPYHYLFMSWSLFNYFDITKDALKALTESLGLLIALQIGYGYLIHSSIKKRKGVHKELNLMYMVVSLVVAIAMASLIYVILVLFGAPFLSLTRQTALLALHLSLMVVFPLLIAFKFIDSPSFGNYLEQIVKSFNFKNEMYCISAGVIVGTWMGCFPIPLDWDRDWQAWPITLITGGYLGGFVGGVASLVAKTFI